MGGLLNSPALVKTFFNITVVLFFVVLAFLLGTTYKGTATQNKVEADTVVVRDTVSLPPPAPEIRYVVRVDSVAYYIQTTDTVIRYVHIPVERVEYRTPEYYAIVEGYKPSLYHIETYNKTVYVDRVERVKVKARWGLGIQVGYGYAFNKFQPYIGLGVQYNLISW